jgi:hypothetical protein
MKNKSQIKKLNLEDLENRRCQFIKINWNKCSIHFLDAKGHKRVEGLIGLPDRLRQ